MPKFFVALDKIRPVYDVAYKVIMVICKLLLTIDILVTSFAVLGRYVPFIPDPAWTEQVVLTCMVYMAVLSATLAIRKGAHIRMTALDRYLPDKLIMVLDVLADIAVMALHHLPVLWLAGVPVPPGQVRQVRVHALAEPVLDVLPHPRGGRGHDHLRAGGYLQPHQGIFCTGGKGG